MSITFTSRDWRIFRDLDNENSENMMIGTALEAFRKDGANSTAVMFMLMPFSNLLPRFRRTTGILYFNVSEI
jgi:hypothetical protein